MKKEKINKNKKKYLIIPVTFSKGLKLQASWVTIQRHLITKKWQYTALSVVSVMLMSGGIFFYENYTAKGATYGWLQTDWSGGLDGGVTANHDDHQEIWDRYYSKTSNMSAGTALTLTNPAPAVWTETEDADFSDNGTGDDVYIANGSIQPKKSNGASCTSDDECLDLCVSNTCIDSWISGSCSGIDVYFQDISTTKTWKTSRTSCADPQCISNVLVADNSVDFSDYPARDACKNLLLGGRLPSLVELLCMFNNQADYGGNFSAFYWSSDQSSATNAYARSITLQLSLYKDDSYAVRCVRDQ